MDLLLICFFAIFLGRDRGWTTRLLNETKKIIKTLNLFQLTDFLVVIQHLELVNEKVFNSITDESFSLLHVHESFLSPAIIKH